MNSEAVEGFDAPSRRGAARFMYRHFKHKEHLPGEDLQSNVIVSGIAVALI